MDCSSPRSCSPSVHFCVKPPRPPGAPCQRTLLAWQQLSAVDQVEDGSFCEYSDHFDKTIFGNITSIVESRGTSDRQVSVQGTPKAWSHDYHRESNHNSLPPRSREVIAHALGVLEEVLGHLSTHSVTPAVPRICPERCRR